MLTLRGTSRRMCDGVSRRRFIQLGALSYFGLTLPDLLRAEAQSRPPSKRSVILIWQHGGPSQLDTFDMKPNTSSEIRGPYKSMSTTLPGLSICELMPYHAQIMDKCTVIRSFTHGNGDHWAAAHWMLTGYLGATGGDRAPRNPSMGAVMSHLLGPQREGVPATVNMNDGGFGYHGASFLGVAHQRGMLDDTLVITAGEFGRTPRINDNAGRDHWPQAQSILIAGGGYRHGQVIGSTNSKAEYPTSRAVSPADLNAIVYRAVGLSPDDSIRDPSGRPTKLVPGGEVPYEMI